MTDTALTLKDMCAKFDVTPRTLRYYEYIELIAPQKQGRTRIYTAREVARMKLILRGRRFGFSLEEIRQWLLIYQNKGTAAQLHEWVRLADRQLDALAQQKSDLEASIADLQALRTQALQDLAK
ncbi:MAG: MerR family DNA-binding transcriptional regulator [Cypionkella sp.]|nr:MerR family DNA-binding transcriptional regulator [Cypionkella sp.]